MIFTAPLLLIALAALPVLWWLLRVTPPAPKTQSFPAIGLLLGLRADQPTSSRTPWWLLLLRLVTASLVIIGLAGPVLDAATGLRGTGPVLLVIDDGWAAAPDWSTRMRAAEQMLDRADRASRPALLLSTAPTETGTAPAPTPVMPVPELRTRLAALRPKPWSTDHADAAAALAKIQAGDVVYLTDGIATPADPAFTRALSAVGPVDERRADPVDLAISRPPRLEADRLVARVDTLAQPADRAVSVLAQTSDGRTLARGDATIPAGAKSVDVPIQLPPEIRNDIARLTVGNANSAAGTMLLDERWRRRPVGLLAEAEGADTPLIGPLFYPRRALSPFTELREGILTELLARPLSVLVLADVVLDRADSTALAQWVDKGGLLIRFAGPRTAEASTDPDHDDPLLPVHLLAGDRQLGGALSWSEPAALAPFPATSPFAGLPIPDDVKISRQVLAEPSGDLVAHTWASLADGTPLVTAASRGAGRIVLIGTTGNADWSNLPLSGLFVDMLRRLVDLSAGVATTDETAQLPPFETLDGFGALTAPPPVASAVQARELNQPPASLISPRHPPGLYGPPSYRRALNLGSVLPELEAALPIPGATLSALAAPGTERVIGPSLLAAAIVLLALDLLISLALRGKLALRAAASVVLLLCLPPAARAEDYPSLHAQLAYVETGDAAIDATSKSGLTGLSTYVNRRTAVTLGDPEPIVPGRDDLSFYPLLYWPITTDAVMPASAIEALNDFTNKGGIILIDTRDGGSGEGFAPGTEAALKRLTTGLAIPPLTPLTSDHVIARSFYLLQDFPGRFDGDTVWVQRAQDRANDSVSPVIIGGHDWAAAWAVDAAGRNPFATIPGGTRQRTLAYRFGVNLVMYALTGNYKGDQVHVPAILERLGQ